MESGLRVAGTVEFGGLERAPNRKRAEFLVSDLARVFPRAKIPADSDVELVIYPPRKSFYELVSEQLSGSSDSVAMSGWLSANLSRGELDAIRAIRGPFTMFHRGEILALMPSTFIR